MSDRNAMLEENAPWALREPDAGSALTPFGRSEPSDFAAVGAYSTDRVVAFTDEDGAGPLIVLGVEEAGEWSTIFLSAGEAARLRDWLTENIRRRNEVLNG
jgi:hypothetical protein